MDRLVRMVPSAFLLLGCAVERPGDLPSELTENGNTSCVVNHVVPIHRTTGREEVIGEMTLVTGASYLVIGLVPSAGWSLGEVYVTVGNGTTSMLTTANPDPRAAGYLPSVEMAVPLRTLGLSCGSSFTLHVWMVARHDRDRGRHFASAYGARRITPRTHGWESTYVICCPDFGCTYTRGYWRNHPDAWPAGALTLGAHAYTQPELLDILAMPARGDASIILAAQLVAALLNVASGASGTSAITEAQSWMSANGSLLPHGTHASTTAGSQAVAIAEALAAYNEGTTGPGHCDD